MTTIVDYKALFEMVQLSGLFADSKVFPDMVALKNLSEIAQDFDYKKNKLDFNLKEFVFENFQTIATEGDTFVTHNSDKPEEHIHRLWEHLTKKTIPENLNSTYISLPNEFIVPGGRFQEIYYWDSYFSMLGLIVSKKYDLVEGMIDNFAYLIHTYGFIPNGNRTYFLSRSQPPFFSMMVGLLDRFESKKKPKDFLIALEKEYDFWMSMRSIPMPDGEILNRYDDNNPTPRPESYKEDLEQAEVSIQSSENLFRNLRAACESGWDFSSRWLLDPLDLSTINTTHIIPVDLNCLLLNLERIIAELHPIRGTVFEEKAKKREKAILKYFWNDEKGFFCDYDLENNCKRENLTLAAAFPLYFKVANADQAQSFAKVLETDFLKKGGLLTTTFESGQQWDAPNGWAPLQWMAYVGLKNYDFNDLAEKVKTNWLTQNEMVFGKTGKFTEKYNVETNALETGGGEYPNQDGFGWTNGVYLSFKYGV